MLSKATSTCSDAAGADMETNDRRQKCHGRCFLKSILNRLLESYGVGWLLILSHCDVPVNAKSLVATKNSHFLRGEEAARALSQNLVPAVY